MFKSKQIYKIPNILCQTILTGHQGPVEAILIHENTIISASRDKTIKIWDISSGENTKTLTGHSKTITSLDVAKNFLISGSKDKTIRIWDLNSGECIKILEGHTGDVLSVSLSDNLIASGSLDSTIRIWDFKSGECLKTLDDHSRNVSWVKIREDKLYSTSWDHFLKIWDLKTYECLNSLEEHSDAINVGGVSKNFVVTGDQTGYINVINNETQEIIHRLKQHKRAIMGLFIEDNYLYSTSMDRTVMMWDLNTGILLKKLEGHEDATLGIYKDKNIIVSSSADNTIRLWDDFSVHNIKELEGHDTLVLQTVADKNTLISTGADNVIKVWDIKQGKLTKSIDPGIKSWIWGLGFEEKHILISSDDGIYRLYDLDTGELIRQLKGHEGTTYRAMIRNNLAITTSWDNTARVWDINTGECLHILKGHNYPVYSAAITDEEEFVTGSSDGTIRYWNKEGKQKRVIKFHQDEVFHIAVEGDIVVSAGGDGICGVFNFKTGEILAELDDHLDQVWTVQIHRGLVISGSADNTIKIWDYKQGICLDTFEGHTNNVKDLTVSGNNLISASLDTSIKIWDLSKYLGESEKLGALITPDYDALVSQIQLGRTYNTISPKLGDPEIPRMIYGMKSLKGEESPNSDKMLQTFKGLTKSWKNLGKIGYAPWIEKITEGFAAGDIEVEDDEVLQTILQKFIGGLHENRDLYWSGLLRHFGDNMDSLFNRPWTFTLEFSGQGPNPLEQTNWVKLASKLNISDLEDREENTLVFRLTLNNLHSWITPLIKAIEIQVKDDRGDVSYMHFNDFLPNPDGNWFTTAMFKIDSGYRMEPTAIINFTDVRVIYDDALCPSFEGSNMIKQLTNIRLENQMIQNQLDHIQDQFITLSEEIANCELEPIPKKNIIKTSLSVKKEYKLQDLYDSPKSLEIFRRIKSNFNEPRIGMIKMNIKGMMNKFLEYIQPKFILFTAGASIASALISVLIYISLITKSSIGGQIDNNLGYQITWVEIIIYILIYSILMVLIITSITNWIKYHIKKKKQNISSPVIEVIDQNSQDISIKYNKKIE